MIRFVIAMKEKEKLTSLLNLNDNDYLTILVNNYGAYFMVDGTELYVHKLFIHLERNGITEPFCFRISKKKFLGLLIEGSVEFKIIDNKVNIQFINVKAEKVYTFTTIYEEDTYERYADKLDLLSNLYDYPLIEIDKLAQIIKMSRSLGIALNCIDGISFIRLPSVGVFMPTECTNFTVSGKLLSFVSNYTTNLRNAQNYLGYKSEDVAILITKYRDTAVNEFTFIDKEKSSFKVSFILNHMIDLCKRLKFSDGTFVLDLENSKATFEEDKNLYETAIEVTEIKSAKLEREKKKSQDEVLDLDAMFEAPVDDNVLSTVTYGIPKLIIPATVLRNILFNISSLRKIVLYVKKNFIQMKIGELNVVFARSDLKC